MIVWFVAGVVLFCVGAGFGYWVWEVACEVEECQNRYDYEKEPF